MLACLCGSHLQLSEGTPTMETMMKNGGVGRWEPPGPASNMEAVNEPARAIVPQDSHLFFLQTSSSSGFLSVTASSFRVLPTDSPLPQDFLLPGDSLIFQDFPSLGRLLFPSRLPSLLVTYVFLQGVLPHLRILFSKITHFLAEWAN